MQRHAPKVQLSEFIKAWIAEHKGFDAETLDTKKHLFQAGYLDSLGLFRLIFDVESEFDVEFDQNELFRTGAIDIDALSEAMSQCVLSESN